MHNCKVPAFLSVIYVSSFSFDAFLRDYSGLQYSICKNVSFRRLSFRKIFFSDDVLKDLTL